MLDLFSDMDLSFGAKIFSFADEKETTILTPHFGILFILEGQTHVNSVTTYYTAVEKGQMVLLSPRRKYVFTHVEDFRGLFLQIPGIETFCYHFFPASVFRKQLIFKEDHFLLSIDHNVGLVIKDIEYYLLNDFSNAMLLQIKISELFYFYSFSYSIDSLAHFFAPVIFPDYVFSRFVLDNYMSVKTVEELAELSHYSLSGFQKQFRKVFGVAPYKWIVMKKTEKVYYEIHQTSKPLKVIAEEAGFAGLSQLSDFCRKRLGQSPTEIRRKR